MDLGTNHPGSLCLPVVWVCLGGVDHPSRAMLTGIEFRGESVARRLFCQETFRVKRLSEEVGTIAAAFYPKPVVVRMSDFIRNEYVTLIGGMDFETVEDNPMIGFLDASRYTHPAYAEGFDLECQAMCRVREEMGFTNVVLMIPFCRRVEEGEKVIEAMARNRLHRGDTGLEIYMIYEIPNNVLQIDAFARLFDGFSIGSNDLTPLTLGFDRDSEIVAFEFDERDPGIKP